MTLGAGVWAARQTLQERKGQWIKAERWASMRSAAAQHLLLPKMAHLSQVIGDI